MVNNDKIKISGSPVNMLIEFLEGRFAGQKYEWPGERLTDGRFWLNTSKDISQFSPQKRIATDEEREYVIAAVHQKNLRVIFPHD